MGGILSIGTHRRGMVYISNKEVKGEVRNGINDEALRLTL